MNAFSVCESIWHTHTHSLCRLLCSDTCDRQAARGCCLSLLMCNSSQFVVDEACAIYRNNSSLWCMLCLWGLGSQFSFYFLTWLWDFFLISSCFGCFVVGFCNTVLMEIPSPWYLPLMLCKCLLSTIITLTVRHPLKQINSFTVNKRTFCRACRWSKHTRGKKKRLS